MSHPTPLDGYVLLGTVAIEPNRWGTVRPDRSPSTRVAEWLDRIAQLPVDGLELWENHLPTAESPDAAAFATSATPIRILNSYVSFDAADPAERRAVADAARRCGANAVKFNVGSDPSAIDAYTNRLGAWVEDLDGIAAVCECHQGISVAEDPTVASRILNGAGSSQLVQALVHTHDAPDLLAAKFDALGERITHVHVNHLDLSTMSHPTLDQVHDELGRAVDTIRRYGFTGSWTLEFVAGLLTSVDHAAALLDQVAADLPILRDLLERR